VLSKQAFGPAPRVSKSDPGEFFIRLFLFFLFLYLLESEVQVFCQISSLIIGLAVFGFDVNGDGEGTDTRLFLDEEFVIVCCDGGGKFGNNGLGSSAGSDIHRSNRAEDE
jgi:hypothetical protein